MQSVAAAATVLAAAVWVGSIVFQSLVVAPSVFTSLDIDAAGRFLRKIFPRFFALGLICGGVLLLGLIGLGVANDWSGNVPWLIGGATLMLIANTLCLALVPPINAARDQGEAGKKRFRQLHAVTVLLTLAVLGLGAVTLIALVITGNAA